MSEYFINDLKKHFSGNKRGNQHIFITHVKYQYILNNSYITNPLLIIAGSDDVIKEEHSKESLQH